MCIYYKERDDLVVPKSQEHIFPAFLGGKTKLPLGYVSDEANKLFSPLEKRVSVNSIVGVERMMEGPGKRGKKKRSSPVVHIGIASDGAYMYQIIDSAPIIIPFVRVKRDLSNIEYCQNHMELPDKNSLFSDFISSLKTFDGKYVDKGSKYIENDEILIGYKDKKFFVGHSIDTDVDKNEIKGIIDFLQNNNYQIEDGEQNTDQPEIEIKIEFNNEYDRVYAKIGFNCLAYIMGDEYVKNDCFNQIRKYILGEEKYIAKTGLTSDNPLSGIKYKFHYCLFYSIKGHLCAMICFYNEWTIKFDFGEIPNPEYFRNPIGMVCDYQKGEEYDLIEFFDKYPSSI